MDAWTAGDNFPLLYRYLQSHPSALANGLPYSLHVQARSNLKLVAQCLQDSYEPGAELRVRGVLTEYGLPIDGRATLRAEMTRPDGTAATLSMPEIEPGVFEAVEIAHQSGVYRFRSSPPGARCGTSPSPGSSSSPASPITAATTRPRTRATTGRTGAGCSGA